MLKSNGYQCLCVCEGMIDSIVIYASCFSEVEEAFYNVYDSTGLAFKLISITMIKEDE